MNTEQESNADPNDDAAANEQSAEQFQPTIKELEEGVWQATRGPGTKAAAWFILIGMAVCLIGLVIITIITLTASTK